MDKGLEKVILNKDIPEHLRLRVLEQCEPKETGSGKKSVLRKIASCSYASNKELRADLEKIGMSLEWSFLPGADLSAKDLRGVNLSVSVLARADLTGADCSHANLSIIDLSGARLSGCNLSMADLSLSNLSGADFSRANLSMANLRGSDLSGCNFSGANLSMADLSDSNITNANFSGATTTGMSIEDSLIEGTGLGKRKRESALTYTERYSSEPGGYLDSLSGALYSDADTYRVRAVYRRGG